MNDDRTAQGWWSSLPGVLTASATAITAVGGLIAILAQTGIFHASTPAAPTTPASAVASTSATTLTPTAAPVHTPAQTQTPASAQTAAQASTPSTPSTAIDTESSLSYFAGSWKNVDPSTNGITGIQIRLSGSSIYVHAWGKCRPTDCDWGEVKAEGYGSNVGSANAPGIRVVTAEFKNNVHHTVVTIHPAPNDRIRVEAATDFIDQSGRAALARRFLFHRMP